MTGHLAMSLESRGFGLMRERTFLEAGRFGRRDALAPASVAGTVAATWGLTLRGRFWGE